MIYPKVKRSHILPQVYLRGFATGEQIAMRLVGERESKIVNVRDAAVRARFYRRTRPDGELTDDIEWSLSRIEDAVAPLLRSLPSAWPLPLKDKAALAEFFALQLVRGPRWREHYERFLSEEAAEWRQDGSPGVEGVMAEVVTERIASKMETRLRDDTQRNVRMLSLVPKAATIFASMGWTLVSFDRPMLATSDHPVVVWPLEPRARAPEPPRFRAGLLPTLEVRVPLSPHLALLMTWRPADEPNVVQGRAHHAKNINAFTVAQAERQWFHQPGTSPPLAGGRLLAISPEIHSDYSHEDASQSPLRAEVSRRIQPRLGTDFEQHFSVVTVESRTSG